jgi:hypothetical protein
MLIYATAFEAKPGKAGVLAPHVATLRDVCAKATGQAWHAWGAVSGRPFGSFALTTRHDGMAAMVDAGQQVMASPAFHELSAGFSDALERPAETMLSEVIGMTGAPSDPKQFSVVTRAVATARVSGALAWANKVMGHVTEVTGVDAILTVGSAGNIYQVTWVSSVDTASEIDAMSGKIAADPGYLTMLDEAADLFIPGSAERFVLSQLA